MKLFWIIIALLIALAAATLLWPTRSTTPRLASQEPSLPRQASPRVAPPPAAQQRPTSTAATRTAPPAGQQTTQQAHRDSVRTIADMSPAELADTLRAEAARIAAERATPPAEPGPPETDPATPPEKLASNQIFSLDDLLGLESSLPETPTPDPQREAATVPPESPADNIQSASAVPTTLSDNDAVSEIAPMRSRPGEDGWTILDERFPIRGSGLPDDPYEVSWELLVSASETYQPRLGKTRIPERIAMLDGKFVRVVGYVAFPIMAMEQNELLSMRNMWDGCCIGVPPTPYDAIEVRLQKAATGQDRFTAFGSVEGLFKVDPYVKGNWLLGLYLMEDATLAKTRDVEMPKPTHERLPGF